MTRDHGAAWTDVTPAVAAAGAPADRYVSRVFASPHDAGTAFVSKSGFRNDDFRPFLYRTTDFGKTWTRISGNLAASPINVVVQDRKNRNLLIVGNDLGVWVSIDGGGALDAARRRTCRRSPVHDLTIHPRENDLVLGTYGRGILIGDITPLQDLSADVLDKPSTSSTSSRGRPTASARSATTTCSATPTSRCRTSPTRSSINYSLRAKDEAGARVTIADIKGTELAQLKGPSEAGLNRVLWNMRAGAAPTGGRGGRGGAGPTLPAGDYRITRRSRRVRRRRTSAGFESGCGRPYASSAR